MCAVKDDQSVVIDRETDQGKSHKPSGPRIRCPLCGWSPRKEDKWFCTCGHEWNTFDTGGICPACLHQWTAKPSASSVAAGRRIRIGILANLEGRSTHGQGQRAVSERSRY